MSISSLVKPAELAILTLLESLYIPSMKKGQIKNECSRKFMREKKASLSVCLRVKKVELFTFENIWIWLDELFEIFISDESTKNGKAHTKKKPPWLVFTLIL